MNHRYQWMHRKEMIEQGKRIIWLHWNNKVSWQGCEDWFTRNIYHYAAAVTGDKTDNREGVRRRFWADVIRELEYEHEITN